MTREAEHYANRTPRTKSDDERDTQQQQQQSQERPESKDPDGRDEPPSTSERDKKSPWLGGG